jgi:hypothetical protein
LKLEEEFARREDWELWVSVVKKLLRAGYSQTDACEGAHLLLRARRAQASGTALGACRLDEEPLG